MFWFISPPSGEKLWHNQIPFQGLYSNVCFSEEHLGTSMILGVGGNETPVETGFFGNVTIYSAGDSARLSKESSLWWNFLSLYNPYQFACLRLCLIELWMLLDVCLVLVLFCLQRKIAWFFRFNQHTPLSFELKWIVSWMSNGTLWSVFVDGQRNCTRAELVWNSLQIFCTISKC